MDNAREGSHHVTSGKALFVLFVVLPVVLYITVLAVSRTDRFRVYVRNRVGEFLRWPVEIERAHLSPGLNLVLEGVASRGELVAGQPGFRAQHVVVDYSLINRWLRNVPALRRLNVENVYWSVARDINGLWQPTFFAGLTRRLGTWLGCGDFAMDNRGEDSARSVFLCPLTLKGGRAVVYETQDVLVEWIGLEWQTEVFKVGPDRILFRRVRASQVACTRGEVTPKVRVEFLQTPKRTIVLECESGVGQGSSTSTVSQMAESADESVALSEAWRRAKKNGRSASP